VKSRIDGRETRIVRIKSGWVAQFANNFPDIDSEPVYPM